MDYSIDSKRFIFAAVTLMFFASCLILRWWWVRVPSMSVGAILLLFCAFQLLARSNDGFGLKILFSAVAEIVSFIAIGITAYQIWEDRALTRLIFEVLGSIILTLILVGCSSDFLIGLLLRLQGSRMIP